MQPKKDSLTQLYHLKKPFKITIKTSISNAWETRHNIVIIQKHVPLIKKINLRLNNLKFQRFFILFSCDSYIIIVTKEK